MPYSIVRGISDVDLHTLSTIGALLEVLFAQFGQLNSKTAPRAAAAMQRLLVALLGKEGALEQLLQPFVGKVPRFPSARPSPDPSLAPPHLNVHAQATAAPTHAHMHRSTRWVVATRFKAMHRPSF